MRGHSIPVGSRRDAPAPVDKVDWVDTVDQVDWVDTVDEVDRMTRRAGTGARPYSTGRP